VYRAAVIRTGPVFAIWLVAACAGDGSGPPASSPGDAGLHTDARPGLADGSAAGDASPPGPCGEAVCEDFESAAVGSVPGAPWTVSTPSCSGKGTLAIDDTQAHTGAHALVVHGGDKYCDHVFLASAVPAKLAGTLHVRFYVRFDDAFTDAHTTFLALADKTDGKDLRMGGQKGIFMWNREAGDATLPALSPTGIALSVSPTPDAWHCVQIAIDPTGRTLHTSIDGIARSGLVIDTAPTPDIDQQWLSQPWMPDLQNIRFGWEAYGGPAMTLWFDDLAIGSSPLDCN